MQIARAQTSVGGGNRIAVMARAGNRLLKVTGGNRLVLATAPAVAGGESWGAGSRVSPAGVLRIGGSGRVQAAGSQGASARVTDGPAAGAQALDAPPAGLPALNAPVARAQIILSSAKGLDSGQRGHRVGQRHQPIRNCGCERSAISGHQLCR